MEQLSVNYLAVLAGAVLSMVVGFFVVWTIIWEEVDGDSGSRSEK